MSSTKIYKKSKSILPVASTVVKLLSYRESCQLNNSNRRSFIIFNIKKLFFPEHLSFISDSLCKLCGLLRNHEVNFQNFTSFCSGWDDFWLLSLNSNYFESFLALLITSTEYEGKFLFRKQQRDVKFFLYTRENAFTGQELIYGDENLLYKSNINPSVPTRQVPRF